MSDLGLLAVGRAGLPDFPGASYQEKLMSARFAALLALQKYVPNLAFDPAGADKVLSQIEVWEERNRDRLEAAFADTSSETLARDLALELSNETAQSFVVACFTRAAYGLGPWQSGAVTQISATWAQSDAETRLQVFGGIVKMDEDGFLAELWSEQGVQGYGLGALPVWAILVLAVAVAAIFATLLFKTKVLSDNNRLMSQLCQDAQAKGDQVTVQKCIEATQNLQQEGLFPGVDKGISTLVTILGLGFAIYVGFQLMPYLFRSRRAA
jgi:hypothetical protein